jgi:ferrochelatase
MRLRQTLGENLRVAVGMRYGEPGIAAALDELERAQARRIVVLPLYPQYTSSSTAAAFDAVWAALASRRRVPELHTIASYHDDPAYVGTLAESVRAHWRVHGRGDHLLLSFHGIPQHHVDGGDPYAGQCHATARLLAQELQLAGSGWTIAFQSRLGRIPWLQPYTDQLLPQLAARGVKRLDVICPGFAADCLETLEEVAIRYRAAFAAAGGELRYVAALNDRDAHADAIAGLAGNAAANWLPALSSPAQLPPRALQERT